MKTLDEVIKAFEICIGYYCSNAEHDVCPYLGESDMGCMKEPEKDALYYLKMYRSDQIQWEADRKLWVDKQKQVDEARQKYIDKLKELEIGTLNDPLTWDELKGMEGKPVWIELLNYGMWDDPSHRVDLEWWVIGEVRKDDIILATYLDEMELCEDDLGVIWQAYRKERK